MEDRIQQGFPGRAHGPVKAAEGLWKHLHKSIKASDQLGLREGLIIGGPSGSLYLF